MASHYEEKHGMQNHLKNNNIMIKKAFSEKQKVLRNNKGNEFPN
jgi:hypothetical protein